MWTPNSQLFAGLVLLLGVVTRVAVAQDPECTEEQPEDFSLCQSEFQSCTYPAPFPDPLCGVGCSCLSGTWLCEVFCQLPEPPGCPAIRPMEDEQCIIGGIHDNCIYQDPNSPLCSMGCSCPSGTFSCSTTSCRNGAMNQFVCPEDRPVDTEVPCDFIDPGFTVCEYEFPNDPLCFHECLMCPSGSVTCLLRCDSGQQGPPPLPPSCPESPPESTDTTCDDAEDAILCIFEDPNDELCSIDCQLCASGSATCATSCEDTGATCPESIPADTEVPCDFIDLGFTVCEYPFPNDPLCFHECLMCPSGSVSCLLRCDSGQQGPPPRPSCPESPPDSTDETCNDAEDSTLCIFEDPNDELCSIDCQLCSSGSVTCETSCEDGGATCPESLPADTEVPCDFVDLGFTVCEYDFPSDPLCFHECLMCPSGSVSCLLRCDSGPPPPLPPSCPESPPESTATTCDDTEDSTLCIFEDPNDELCSIDCQVCSSGSVTCETSCEDAAPETPFCPESLPLYPTTCGTLESSATGVCTYPDVNDPLCSYTCECSGLFACTRLCESEPPTIPAEDTGSMPMGMMMMGSKKRKKAKKNNSRRNRRALRGQ